MWVEIRAFIAGVIFTSAVWGAWHNYVNATHMRWMAERTEASTQHLLKRTADIRARGE